MVESRDSRSIYQLCSVTIFVFLDFFSVVFVSDVSFDFVSSKYHILY
jgi:hypothetical protein